MLTHHRFVLLFAILAILSPGAFSEEAAPVKCLQIGLEPHGAAGVWNDALAAIKANYPSVDITAVEKDNLEALQYDNLTQYDVLHVVHIKTEDGNPPDSAKEAILQFLKEGGGLVVNHFAVANCQNWRDSIDIYGAMWVSGKSTHGPYHTFRVDVIEEAHPILEGVQPFTTDDELYYNLLMRPDMRILMAADEERFGHTVAEPMLCTHYVHNARCVYFALGHDEKSVSHPMFHKIVAQSIEWAAGKR